MAGGVILASRSEMSSRPTSVRYGSSDVLLRDRVPLGDPRRVVTAGAEDDARDHDGDVVGEPVRLPVVGHRVVDRARLLDLEAGLRVDEPETQDALGCAQGRAHGDEAALRHPDEERSLDPEV